MVLTLENLGFISSVPKDAKLLISQVYANIHIIIISNWVML